MALSPSAYVDAFAYDSPSRVGRKLGQRLASAKQANDKLAGLFAERAEIEENYANALQAAIQRWERAGSGHMVPGSASAQAVERTIVNETSNIAALHQKFAARCRRDIQQPLASRHTSQDWALLRGLEQNSESLLTDNHDNQNAKSSKSGTSGLIPGRSKNTNAGSSGSSEQWKENAPALLNQYQQVDAGRLNTLKELLTVFETLQNDLGRERMEIAERGLAAILSWEVEQEMTEFISREGFKSSGGAEESTQSGTPAIAVQSPTVNDFGAYNGARPQRRNTQTDAQSVSNGRAPSVISSRVGNDNDEKDGKPKKKGGLLSAFKKNKDDKRKSVAPPPPAQRTNSGDGNFGSSARDSRDRQSSTRSGASSDDFGQDSGALRPSAGTGRKSNRDSFMPSFSSLGLKRRGTMTSPAATPALNTATQPMPSTQTSFPQSPYEETPDLPTAPARRSSQDTANGTTGNPFAASMRRDTASPAVEQVNLFGDDDDQPRSSTQRQVDNQGYSVPPQDYNRPLGNSTSGANLMDMPDSDDENETPQAMKVNIQPATTVSREDDAEREAAMLRMKNTLSAGLSPSPSSINRRGTRANRSSRQSTMGSVTSDSSPVPASSPGDEIPIAQIMEMHRQQRQPPPIPQHRHTSTPAAPVTQQQPTSPTEVLASPSFSASPPPTLTRSPPPRAESILSTSSSQIFTPAGQGKSPFSQPNAPGLRASILETVNVILQGGQVQRVMVTGEISMSLSEITISGPLRLRIDGFESFDRSAPNNAILSGSAGEYAIDAHALQNSRTGLTTVFKYSLSTQGSAPRALVPIEVTPQWKIEPNQTSFLMAYHGNPTCQFATAEDSPFGNEDGAATTLHDLMFSVPIASGCNNLQTKPDGVYSSERKQISWQMDEFNISETRTAKILARFQTDTEGTQQPVSVSWKLPGRLASKIGIHVDGANLDEIARNTQSGKYIAQA